MISKSFRFPPPLRFPVAIILIALLSGCSTVSGLFSRSAKKPQPAELQPVVALVPARQIWSARVGEVTFALQAAVSGETVVVASTDGTVAALDARSGRDLWRTNIGTPIAAGVGSDGKLAAVVSRANEAPSRHGRTRPPPRRARRPRRRGRSGFSSSGSRKRGKGKGERATRRRRRERDSDHFPVPIRHVLAPATPRAPRA